MERGGQAAARERFMLTAAAIKRVRGSLGLTQVEFALLLGVATNTASRWETGILTPNAWQVAIICAVAEAARTLGDGGLDSLPLYLREFGGVAAALGLLLRVPPAIPSCRHCKALYETRAEAERCVNSCCDACWVHNAKQDEPC